MLHLNDATLLEIKPLSFADEFGVFFRLPSGEAVVVNLDERNMIELATQARKALLQKQES